MTIQLYAFRWGASLQPVLGLLAAFGLAGCAGPSNEGTWLLEFTPKHHGYESVDIEHNFVQASYGYEPGIWPWVNYADVDAPSQFAYVQIVELEDGDVNVLVDDIDFSGTATDTTWSLNRNWDWSDSLTGVIESGYHYEEDCAQRNTVSLDLSGDSVEKTGTLKITTRRVGQWVETDAWAPRDGGPDMGRMPSEDFLAFDGDERAQNVPGNSECDAEDCVLSATVLAVDTWDVRATRGDKLASDEVFRMEPEEGCVLD